jgi:membrane protease YdiL (CAAX protease family)
MLTNSYICRTYKLLLQDFNNLENNNREPHHNWITSLNPFGYVIIVLAIIFFLYQVLGAVIAFAAGGPEIDSNVELLRIILSFGQFMFILAPAIFFTRLQTPYLKETFRLNAPPPFLLLLSIIGIILIQPALQGYLHLQDYILNNLPVLKDSVKQLKDFFDIVEQSTMKIVTAYSPLEFAVVVFVIAVTPAVCEEILFRGFVLKKVARSTIAIFLSGFLFALYHFQPFNLIPLIALGFYLGFIVYCSNSIFTGMISHFLNNFLAAFYIYKFGKDEFDTPKVADSEVFNTAIAAIAGLLIFILVLFLMYRFRVKEKNNTTSIE